MVTKSQTYKYVGIAYNQYFIRGDVYYSLKIDVPFYRILVVDKYGLTRLVNSNQFELLKNL